jgi:hypothetical protein
MSKLENPSKPTASQREILARRAEWRSCRNTRSMWRLVYMGQYRVKEGSETSLYAAARVECVVIWRAWASPSPEARRRWLPRRIRP